MHFTYSQTDDSSADLCQGDILKRTIKIDAVFEEFHNYYHTKVANEFYIVLTQSCDLVRRNNTDCKARYISLAPVRKLRIVLDRYIEGIVYKLVADNLPVCIDKKRDTYIDFFF